MRTQGPRFSAIGTFLLLTAAVALAQEMQEKKMQHKPAPTCPGFEKLKALAGEWVEAETPAAAMGEKDTKAEKSDKPAPAEKGEKTEQAEKKAAKPAVVYRVVGDGSAVQETLLPGTPHEMVTMYYMDGPDIVLTHYCALHNQPRMKAENSADAAKLVFKFTGGSNIDPAKDGHMHDLTMTFVDADHLRSEWTYYADGKKGDTKTFELTRKKD